ncbi:MAG: ribosome-associated translation inhibitor RaiA [Planctomycetia bacterium]|nr:ribosome-associated translation inhibitor RaiA [Planctomycetia bacterium]
MQINISTRHGNLSEAAQTKITEKVEKLGRFIERVSKIDITVDLEKADQPAISLVVTTELKKEFKADYSSDNLYGCLDQVIDKLENQMRKFKEKLTDHGKK